ncbi:beta-1,3-galactosyltransferase 9-like [Dermacentor silvarum]|uniref:beta-1,3-galactosyltransferase 9-like n=1 Tax=Dermacentor silvarum TaxID=543639 RepID=UPI00189A2D4E|nr:beta-1,3-galactosyltransferase 9-like [Dermacentor silvarum]
MLGKPRSDAVQERIAQEDALHEDIVQGIFVDTYKNLALKSLIMLHLAASFCPNAKFVLKIDDDVLLNVVSVAPYFFIEDVYITELLADKAGVRRVNVNGFASERKHDIHPCGRPRVVTSHRWNLRTLADWMAWSTSNVMNDWITRESEVVLLLDERYAYVGTSKHV